MPVVIDLGRTATLPGHEPEALVNLESLPARPEIYDRLPELNQVTLLELIYSIFDPSPVQKLNVRIDPCDMFPILGETFDALVDEILFYPEPIMGIEF
jgi:hypothetical protein